MAMESEDSLSSRIATLVHAHFDALPARSKPIIRSNGTREWTPMSGIVIVRGQNTTSETLTCVAVTSGAKCLSASQIPYCKGLVLHDLHAEILAVRAFNYWLLSECQSFLAAERNQSTDLPKSPSGHSPYIRRHQNRSVSDPPFELHPDLKIYMYCTCAPCGDASMELCMASQDDATPWEIETSDAELTPTSSSHTGTLLDGRGFFSRLGIVRRKPARADAEPTRSKSCSDKLALRQVSSLLSYESSLLVATTKNAYLEGVILPEEEISQVACERAFSERGRMRELAGRFWSTRSGIADPLQSELLYGYRFRPFQIISISSALLESLWKYKKNSLTSAGSLEPAKQAKPSVVSAIWVIAPSCSANNGTKSLSMPHGSKTGLYETILNGVKQGSRAYEPTARGASALSRAKMWGLLRDIVLSGCSVQKWTSDGGESNTGGAPLDEVFQRIVRASSYREFKKYPGVATKSISAREKAIQDTKDVLEGWVPNSGDESWDLSVLANPPKKNR
ncbi:putative tRNA-specific adenosine deaminase [Aspergillus ambiguus]|uniref:tRNA-specific adenosine deaminase n=1 Tax=Aspergillus ambiguus TaxID=176160 RepID=UPI003CCCCE4E